MEEKSHYPPPYPSQPAGYPSGYPPSQQGYPPQHGYPSRAYPPANNAPPPYVGVHSQTVQHTSTNVVVVQPRVTRIITRINPAGDNYFTLSLILSIVCIFIGFYSLLCTIPAILFACNAREAERRGDTASQITYNRLSLGCDIAACTWWTIWFVLYIIIGIANSAG